LISSRWPRARRAGAVLAASLALATAPVRAEEASWTGFYLGGHLGTLFSTTSFSDPNGFPIYGGSVSAGGLAAGGQAGYGWQVAPRWVLGVEGEFSVLGAQGSNTCQQWSMTIIGNTCQATPRELATLAGRAGFLLEPGGKTMVYGKAGIAWLRSDVSIAQNGLPSPGEWASLVPLSATPNGAAATTASVSSFGPMLGAGFEYAFAPRWSLKGEYSYLRFGGMSLAVPGPVDINNDGTNDYTVVVAAPTCLLMKAAEGYSVDFAASAPKDSYWNIQAVATDTRTGVTVTVNQGVRVRLAATATC